MVVRGLHFLYNSIFLYIVVTIVVIVKCSTECSGEELYLLLIVVTGEGWEWGEGRVPYSTSR